MPGVRRRRRGLASHGIGYQIIWYRVIGVLVKDSPYAFSSVLAVYLLGIALGSREIHKYLAGKPALSRRDLYFTFQFLIGLAVLLTFASYYYFSRHPPLQWLTRLSFTPSAQKVLVIGFGAGSITEAALIPAEVRQVTVVELCGSLITNLRKFPLFANILSDARIKVVIDDGRRFLQRTDERFDLILMDPLRTTTAYSNNLHSRQFFALAGKHLSPGGILMVGGLGDSPVIARTLLEEYEYVRAYPHFCLASRAPLRQDRERLERVLQRFPADVQVDIQEFAQDPLEGKALRDATAGCPVNEDWRPVSEYYLGLQVRQWLASEASR